MSINMNIKSIHLIYALVFLVSMHFFVACGDSDSATRPTGDSSSVEPSSSEYKRAQCNAEIDENCFKDERDGQSYKIVKIGDQVWMAENLNFKIDSSFCYNDSAEYCEKYGRLYRWAAAVGKLESECGHGYTCSLPSGNIQGVCPNGWHLPSMVEWNTLFTTVGGPLAANMKLRTSSGWNYNSNGTDDFGFSALPAGLGYIEGHYGNDGGFAYFWSSTESNIYNYYAYHMGLCGREHAYLYDQSKEYAFSVRCIKD
jgi:uncharacterized protein (TIGR02145 family)